jgi:hypothetical protein
MTGSRSPTCCRLRDASAAATPAVNCLSRVGCGGGRSSSCWSCLSGGKSGMPWRAERDGALPWTETSERRGRRNFWAKRTFPRDGRCCAGPGRNGRVSWFSKIETPAEGIWEWCASRTTRPRPCSRRCARSRYCFSLAKKTIVFFVFIDLSCYNANPLYILQSE